MTERKKELPSISLEQFIDFVEQCQEAYQLSYSSLGDEDKSLQDYLHAL